MQTVATLVDFARSKGEAFAAGKVATGDTFNSARFQAILPAIKAIEAGEVQHTTDLASQITRAYAEGAKIDYKSERTVSSAVSKTSAFLVAAEHKLMLALINTVETIIREQNDKDVRNKMESGIFGKLNSLSIAAVAAAKDKKVLDWSKIVSVLFPAEVDPTTDEQLAVMFKKMAKLADDISGLATVYETMAVEAKRFQRLSAEHKARAERLNDQKAPLPTVETPVTPQSNNEADTAADVTPQSNNDASIQHDIVDNVLEIA